jgi:oligoendopeptidase F
MTQNVPERKDVPAAYTWDLSKLFADEGAWEEALRVFEAKLPRIEEFKGTLGESPDSLFRCLEFMNELDMADERIGYYAHLKTTEDAGNSSHQDRFSRYLAVSARKAARASYQTPEIQAIPDEVMQGFLNDPILSPYKILLSKILKFKPHVLSENEERLIAMQIESRETPHKVFNALTNVDLDFGSVETPEGLKPLTQTSFSAFMQSEDRAIRRKAYVQFYNTFDRHRNTLAALYEGSVQQDIYLAKVRNYSSSRAMSLFPDEVPESVYDNLISAVRKNLPALHRYYALRKRILSLDSLRHYDVYVPLVKNIRVSHTYEQAVETVIEALSPLGEEYRGILKAGLTGRWVDRYENKGKTSGPSPQGPISATPTSSSTTRTTFYATSSPWPTRLAIRCTPTTARRTTPSSTTTTRSSRLRWPRPSTSSSSSPTL